MQQILTILRIETTSNILFFDFVQKCCIMVNDVPAFNDFALKFGSYQKMLKSKKETIQNSKKRVQIGQEVNRLFLMKLKPTLLVFQQKAESEIAKFRKNAKEQIDQLGKQYDQMIADQQHGLTREQLARVTDQATQIYEQLRNDLASLGISAAESLEKRQKMMAILPQHLPGSHAAISGEAINTEKDIKMQQHIMHDDLLNTDGIDLALDVNDLVRGLNHVVNTM